MELLIQNIGLPEHWSTSTLEYQNIGIPEHWSTRTLEYQNIGIPEHWNTRTLLYQNIGIPEHWNIRYWRVLTLTKSNKEHVSHFILLITCRLTVTKLLKSWNLSSCSNSKVCNTCTRLYMTPPGLFTVPACLYTSTYNVMSTVHGSSLYTPSTWAATLWPLCPLSWDSCFCRLRGWLGKDHWRIYT